MWRGDVTVNQQVAAGLEAGLRAVRARGGRVVVAFVNSELIANLVHRVYAPRNETLR